jgi:hypothetical protein
VFLRKLFERIVRNTWSCLRDGGEMTAEGHVFVSIALETNQAAAV